LKQGIGRNLILEFIDLSAHSGIFSGVQRKTLDPGLRRDDGGNFTVATTTTVIPAQGVKRGFHAARCMPA
jgi:hypothetical protein